VNNCVIAVIRFVHRPLSIFRALCAEVERLYVDDFQKDKTNLDFTEAIAYCILCFAYSSKLLYTIITAVTAESADSVHIVLPLEIRRGV